MPGITGLEIPEQPEAPGSPAGTYTIADDRIEVIGSEAVVLIDGRELDINTIRFGMLTSLASRPDFTMSPSDISLEVWGVDISDSNTLVEQMSLLRKSLGDELGDPKEGAIRTRRGFGYCAVNSLSGPSPDQHPADAYAIADGRLLVSPTHMSVVADGYLLDDITHTEFRILEELARMPNRVVGLGSLGLNIWGYTDQSIVNTVRVHIYNVRKRLGSELGNPKTGALRTRHEVGYYAVSSLNH